VSKSSLGGDSGDREKQRLWGDGISEIQFQNSQGIATRLEVEATKRELTTSGLVREIGATHCEKERGTAGRQRRIDEHSGNGVAVEKRFEQFIFEIGKMRSAMLRVGLQTIPEKTMEQIPVAATHDARNYAALEAAGIDRVAAEPRRYSRATSLAVGATWLLHQRANQPRPW
jgi:hypothetical protein